MCTTSAAVSYLRGRCSSTSRTVASPSLPSFRCVTAATPGSESRPRSRRAGRRARGGGGQAPGWSRPAKTVCRRARVIVRGTERTGVFRVDRTSGGASLEYTPQGDAESRADRREDESRREGDEREAEGSG